MLRLQALRVKAGACCAVAAGSTMAATCAQRSAITTILTTAITTLAVVCASSPGQVSGTSVVSGCGFNRGENKGRER